MLRIPCPYCGLRDHSEFEYGGDASVVYPALDAATEDWFQAVYPRDDVAGPTLEYWRHARGCGLWIVVARDTTTHEILGSAPAHPGLRAETGVVGDVESARRAPAATQTASEEAAT